MITDLGLRSSWISFLRSLKHPRLVMAWRTSGSQSSSVGRMRVWTTDIIGNSNSSSPPRHPALPATTQVWRWISASCGQHHKTNPHAVATACQFSRVNNNHMPRSLQLSRWPPTHTRLNRTYNSSLLVCPSPNVIVIISKFSIILSSTSDADRGVILSTSDLSTSTWDAMEMSLIHSFIHSCWCRSTALHKLDIATCTNWVGHRSSFHAVNVASKKDITRPSLNYYPSTYGSRRVKSVEWELTVILFSGLTSIMPRSSDWHSGGTKWGIW